MAEVPNLVIGALNPLIPHSSEVLTMEPFSIMTSWCRSLSSIHGQVFHLDPELNLRARGFHFVPSTYLSIVF